MFSPAICAGVRVVTAARGTASTLSFRVVSISALAVMPGRSRSSSLSTASKSFGTGAKPNLEVAAEIARVLDDPDAPGRLEAVRSGINLTDLICP